MRIQSSSVSSVSITEHHAPVRRCPNPIAAALRAIRNAFRRRQEPNRLEDHPAIEIVRGVKSPVVQRVFARMNEQYKAKR